MISVSLCTHNPRPDYLGRTLASLRAQTLPPPQWELVVVDNSSREALAGRLDLSWHPSARVVEEPALGLARARKRGFEETRGDLIVTVDDDNELAPDYLEKAQEIGAQYPFLGAWGGQLLPEFEGPAQVDPKYYFHYLALREFKGDHWSNNPADFETSPIGAAMVVRRSVVDAYFLSVASDPQRLGLGRTGELLLGGEDMDLLESACAIGLGKGVFERLRLTHLIPARRMTADFIEKIYRGNLYTGALRRHLRGEPIEDPLPTWPSRLRFWAEALLRRGLDRRLHLARVRTLRQARRELGRSS